MEVLAYGMATPPIGTPQSMTVQMPTSDEEDSRLQVRRGKESELTLRNLRLRGRGDADGLPAWEILEAQ